MTITDVPTAAARAPDQKVSFALRATSYWFTNYKRTWKGTIISGVLEPVFYLAAMGFGLGLIVDANTGSQGVLGLTYLAFLAPGLLAASALQQAMFETTYPVMGAVKWDRAYFAQLATPLRPRDILLGHLVYVLFRVVSMGAVFFVVMMIFGVVESPYAPLALLVSGLLGMAIACPVTAFSVTQESDSGFSLLFRFGMIPIFLFSGTFFPISQLPDAIEWVAWLSPLWHGADLSRALVIGGPVAISPGLAALHVGYLLLWVVGGYVLARRAYRNRLVR